MKHWFVVTATANPYTTHKACEMDIPYMIWYFVITLILAFMKQLINVNEIGGKSNIGSTYIMIKLNKQFDQLNSTITIVDNKF